MLVTIARLVQTGVTCSGSKIYLYCLNWLYGTYFIWRDTLLSIGITGSALLPPQSLWLARLVDSLWEALPSLRSRRGVWWVKVRWREREKGSEWKYVKFQLNNKRKSCGNKAIIKEASFCSRLGKNTETSSQILSRDEKTLDTQC